MKQETKFLTLTSVFIALNVISILIGPAKVIQLGIFAIAVGAISFSLTYPITDVMTEVWGKKATKEVVWSGLIAYLITLVFLVLFIKLPPASYWQHAEAFNTIFSLSIRITIAGVIGYAITQYHDIYAFLFWKKVTNGKHLWIRNNLSTIVSQFIETLIIIVIGFWGILPGAQLMSMFWGWYLFKVLFALGDTPLVYLLVRWAKPEEVKE